VGRSHCELPNCDKYFIAKRQAKHIVVARNSGNGGIVTPTEAAKILESIAERYREPRALEALRLAAEALQNDPATKMRAILAATGKTDVSVGMVHTTEGEVWIAYQSTGPTVSSKSLPEALESLLEKVVKK
jgi:hypothetical protein